MLVQLVCLDRRYQRMNCYNIREIQTILKSKYTPNLSESTDIRFSLSDTTLGLRYHLGELDLLQNSVLSFYQHSLFSNFARNSIYSFVNKPIKDFTLINNFMLKSSFIYHVIISIPQTFEFTINPSSYLINVLRGI